MKKKTDKQIAMRVSSVSILGNVALSVIKLIAGIVANSGAMISDAVHSMSDVISTFVVIIGYNFSSKGSDKDHPYGHERLECIAALFLSAILFVTGAGIGLEGFNKILEGNYGQLAIPGAIALVAAVISIVFKEWMFWYTRHAAKTINSSSLMADAWHHRSDALSSVGSFIGIFGARLGFPILDPIASVVICLFILKAAFDIASDAVDKLTDKACDEKTVKEMIKLIERQPGVVNIDEIKTRLFGNKIYVDVEISVDGNITLNEAHDIAQNVHDVIEHQFEHVKHCMVHVNPDKTNINTISCSKKISQSAI
ncbi:cation diffusion facilitator family transporter [Turicibacter sanguinis]|uniref:cation diffusion facilitator family transporter n=1 Tax=Turicibacter sanguinis TaxID=154288 RepID=UPI0012BB63CA|nr:cation diffusion facilitator family transporter [Turicibacter sanguinis]MTN49418.1 cation diffusion facilitator family transporter [Turicibacter sanguinis]MTN52449.1 cation diffusion facilitator family transporter [Turicibacter sanguinis]MTN55699.1 cation diffusion facilitator family transporter [Turicibacter sanguinis]MTN58763.1 cation diffusion facilitator family transporter [Turicibacter sanguinis]